VPSPPAHLSLASAQRRGWGNLYDALSKGRIGAQGLRELQAGRPFDDLSAGRPAVYAVDVSPWPRCDAEAGPGRGCSYHPSRHSAGQPIVAGWAYQLVARLGFGRDSRVVPADAPRVEPEEDANDVAAEQAGAPVPVALAPAVVARPKRKGPNMGLLSANTGVIHNMLWIDGGRRWISGIGVTRF